MAASDYITEVLADTPLAFWPLNNTATPYNDLSGNGYHGTPGASTAAPTPANTGGPDPALGKAGFDGGDHALMTTVGSFGAGLLGTWTFECWIKTSSKVYNVVSGAVNSGNNVIFDVAINGAQNGAGSTLADNHCVFIRTNSDRSFVWSFTSATLTDGNWHHLVWTATDFAGSGVVAYMDGVNMSATKTRTATAGTVQDFGFPLAIGGRNLRGTITAQITGDLAYGAVYPTALSSGRVAAHYNAMFAADVTVDLDPAGETDQAPELTSTKLVTLDAAVEWDHAADLIVQVAAVTVVDPATETDRTPAVTVSKLVVLDPARETDVAPGLASGKTTVLDRGPETDRAPNLTLAQIATLDLAAEVDRALELILPDPGTGPTFTVTTGDDTYTATTGDNTTTITTGTNTFTATTTGGP